MRLQAVTHGVVCSFCDVRTYVDGSLDFTKEGHEDTGATTDIPRVPQATTLDSEYSPEVPASIEILPCPEQEDEARSCKLCTV